MGDVNIIDLIIFIVALVGAATNFGWRNVAFWLFVVIAAFELVRLLPGGPW